ncbi:TetR/AcrR family transcriptional regulator [Jiangella asiatica]|uniref:TetR/AcrR family transcriptional regulator n=1 Tax=Jiangella asiatica TaxID=2530372 RepID=A0A4V2YZU1_9ACTN|nr:TetR/AcrR family transcriptional regulator [Jiangella asiatica]TDD98227.1 TetR/AcrR family transcriptional regulator [Jiangella asiatica]
MQDRDLASTRTRIQDVALELFAERGYDKTSLREISERLGMTKASLYYYFKSKDDIVQSIVDDLLAAVDDIVDWSRTQTPTPLARRELIERYSKVIRSQGAPLLRFIMENQPAMRVHKAGEAMRSRMQELFDFITDPADPLPVQLCSRMAFYTLHSSPVVMGDVDASPEDIFDAACDVALSMLPDESGRTEPAEGTRG